MAASPSPPDLPSPAADLPRAARITGGVARVGAAGIHFFVVARALGSVLVRTLRGVVRGKRDEGAIVEQMYLIGNQSLLFVSITMGFIGMILCYQAGIQSKRILPDYTMLGATYLELLVRDLAASLGALLLATRVGAGIAAEIGSMVVTEQVDALTMCAADPVDYLVVPRFIASLVMTTALLVWAGAVAYAAGAATAYVAFDVPFRTFCNVSRVDGGDLATGLCKCVAYGAAIPIVSGYCGLSTFGGSEGVGRATTRAVVGSSLAIIVLDAVLSVAGLLVFGAH